MRAEYKKRYEDIKKCVEPVYEGTDLEFLVFLLEDYTYSPYLFSGIFDEGTAIERLLFEEILFVGAGMKVFVNCNDLFYWGCADCEPIEYCEIQELWDMYEKHGNRGPLLWCCLKRNQAPQLPIKKIWEEDGFWSDDLLNPDFHQADHYLSKEDLTNQDKK